LGHNRPACCEITNGASRSASQARGTRVFAAWSADPPRRVSTPIQLAVGFSACSHPGLQRLLITDRGHLRIAFAKVCRVHRSASMQIQSILILLSTSLLSTACLDADDTAGTDSDDPLETSTTTSNVDGQLVCPPTHEKLVYLHSCKLPDNSQGTQTCTDKWTTYYTPIWSFPPPGQLTCVPGNPVLDSRNCTVCKPLLGP
jgi:hypothetical protein